MIASMLIAYIQMVELLYPVIITSTFSSQMVRFFAAMNSIQLAAPTLSKQIQIHYGYIFSGRRI